MDIIPIPNFWRVLGGKLAATDGFELILGFLNLGFGDKSLDYILSSAENP
jgi:hypothetical protein